VWTCRPGQDTPIRAHVRYHWRYSALAWTCGFGRLPFLLNYGLSYAFLLYFSSIYRRTIYMIGETHVFQKPFVIPKPIFLSSSWYQSLEALETQFNLHNKLHKLSYTPNDHSSINPKPQTDQPPMVLLLPRQQQTNESNKELKCTIVSMKNGNPRIYCYAVGS